MNRRFDVCVERVLRHEDDSYDPERPGSGRLVSHASDPGGATRLGITLATFRRWRGDSSLPASALEAMTHEEAKAIYHAFYWNVVRADDLPAGVDYVVFDFAVNSGPRRAVAVLQRILGVTEDGVVGRETLGALAAQDRLALIENYSRARLTFLRSLPHFDTFGRGWTRRVEGVKDAALADAGERMPVAEAARTDTGRGAAFVAGVVAAVTPIVEAVRSLAPSLEGLPLWAVVSVLAAASAIAVVYWRAGRP